jgi:RND family efflux transporter MFP subunit
MKLLFDRQSLAENDYLKFKLAEQAARDQFLQARASEKVARKTLADAVLRAPANGVVTRRLVEPGLTVGTGQPVYEISQMEPLEVQVGVPENLLGTLRIGQAATLTLPALPSVHLTGTLRVLNASADPASRTFMARIAVNNPGKALRPGMVAEARIQGDQTRPMLYLPLEAVTKDAQGATIVFEFNPAERRVYSRRVTLGTLAGEQVQVQAGLEANTPVVVAGQHRLRDGCPVQIETPAGRN